MTAVHDDYKRLEFPPGLALQPCPVCAAEVELWQYSASPSAPTTKTVTCSRGEPFGPQCSEAIRAGCLLFMPPDDFYQPTIREAVKFWNDYAVALSRIQRAGRWERANVLRTSSKGGAA
jgi:hypothetical protein